MSNGEFQMKFTEYVHLKCDMKFTTYPFDHHNCSMSLAVDKSFADETARISFKWSSKEPDIEKRPDVKLEGFTIGKISKRYFWPVEKYKIEYNLIYIVA